MADPSDPRNSAVKAIPSWQRVQPRPSAAPGAEESAKPESTPATAETISTQAGAEESAGAQQSNYTLLDTAFKFLQDSSIRDAPREKKASFLESKGLSKDDIQRVLGNESKNDTPPSTTTQPASAQSSVKDIQQPPQTHDIPPIVTYPEFLVQPQKPPPLITIPRILNTIYVAGGAAVVLYGLSRYVIAPMKDNLNDARHDFFSHTQTRLNDLTTKLASMASSDPTHSHPSQKHKHDQASGDAASEADTEDSDPTELYHRDFGTQTSPGLSRRSSASSIPSLSAPSSKSPSDVLTGHENRLKIMVSHLQELVESCSRSSSTAAELQTQTGELSQYLNEFRYSGPYYGGSGMAGYGSSRASDGIEAFKAEIRGVKGVLLSARNFPGGRAGVR